MKKQQPLFVDFTWGAGGTTSDLTLKLTIAAWQKYGLIPNMHLTCTNMPTKLIDEALEGAKAAGVRNICALRGDPPHGEEEWKATEGGFNCALDLVKHIRKMHGDFFCISVSGYPEGHPNAITLVAPETKLSPTEEGRCIVLNGERFCCLDAAYKTELAYVKEKVDAGADMILTQMFFESKVFLDFKKDLEDMGVNVPCVPGIMLLQNYNGFIKMTTMCKSRVPQHVRDSLEALKDSEDKNAVREYGIKYGTQMCKELVDGGACGLHFYTLNLEKSTLGVMANLDMLKDKTGLDLPTVDDSAMGKGTIFSQTFDAQTMSKGTHCWSALCWSVPFFF
jgi:methylenetetrahydrofolate reductase (NADPH)